MKTQPFRLHSPFAPTGDQPDAIAKLTAGFEAGMKYQTLLGVTGSGKTFTMANVIANLNRPTLILSHNKTLAAQLCTEFREFFPENAVEYSSRTTTTISRKRMFPERICTSKRTRSSTTR